MQKIIFLNSGKIVEVENNIAHKFIDKGLAVLFKRGLDKPKKDKMISDKRLKIRKK